MLQEHDMAEYFGKFNSRKERQAVHKVLDVVAKNTDKKGSELAKLMRDVCAPIEVAMTIFVALGYFVLIQPTREKGVRALHVSDDRISLSKEQKEMARHFRLQGPHGKPVPVIPWKTT